MGDEETWDDQREIVRGFVDEDREMLDEVEPYLIEMERSSDYSGTVDPEVINTIFRLFHSLKGGAGFLELNTIQKVTHVAETLLDIFRKGDATLTSEHIDVDKTIVEQITDPLIHIIRNAIDHGFESPQERREVGKPEVGQLTLEARYSGGDIWISIADDGRGLDRAKILKKARENGLISGDGSEIPDEEVWSLVFQPGFSTADEITDISGRGVGMDVVKQNIEKIHGKVELKSEKGVGTEITLKVPLTLGIIDGMIVRVGKMRYTISIVEVREWFQPDRQMISQTSGKSDIIKLHGEILPVVRLSSIFQIDSDADELIDGKIIVAENLDRKVCLFVDELLGQQQVVIKGLPDHMSNTRGISGCTILGDGNINLIVDVAAIIEMTQKGRDRMI